MERPQTRRGSELENQWEQRASADQPGNHVSDSGNAGYTARPISRMANEYQNQRLNTSRMMTPMRVVNSGTSFSPDPPAGPTQRPSIVSRPGSRAGTALSGGATSTQRIMTPESYVVNKAVERPTTQQGLGGMKTAFRGPQRQIQDKSYFLGLLRSKMSEMNAEINKLLQLNEKNKKEMQNLPALELKVKEMAAEITELQGQAADLNLLQEKLTTGSDAMEDDIRAIATENDKDAQHVEQLFDQVKTVKEKVNLLERDIQMENENAERLISTLGTEERESYLNLKKESTQLVDKLDKLTLQANQLDQEAKVLQDNLKAFPEKEELYNLQTTLEDLEGKRRAMIEQESKRLDPEQERNQLLAAVRSDNIEITAMEQEIKDTQSLISRAQDRLKDIETSVEESRSERSQKYQDLRKREQVMDEFLATWTDSCNSESDRLRQLEVAIEDILRKLGKQQSFLQLIPSITDYSATKEDLAWKEGELEKSRTTLQGIAQEYQRLQSNLQKMEDLEGKIIEELSSLKDRLASIQIDGIKFGKVDDLRHQTEEKRNELILQQQALSERKSQLQEQADDLQRQCNILQEHLDQNETHTTLRLLEDKLEAVEQDNSTMQTFLTEHNTGRVTEIRVETLSLVTKYISALQLTLE